MGIKRRFWTSAHTKAFFSGDPLGPLQSLSFFGFYIVLPHSHLLLCIWIPQSKLSFQWMDCCCSDSNARLTAGDLVGPFGFSVPLGFTYFSYNHSTDLQWDFHRFLRHWFCTQLPFGFWGWSVFQSMHRMNIQSMSGFSIIFCGFGVWKFLRHFLYCHWSHIVNETFQLLIKILKLELHKSTFEHSRLRSTMEDLSNLNS